MRFTLRAGVASLCERCEHGQVMRSDFGHELRWCFNTHPARDLPFPVATCTGYEAKGRMSEYDAKQIGWVMTKKGNRVGFVPPVKKED